MDKKREFTQNLVSNLKSKISEFKNKKNKDRAERKNELDFEINKDLVNKFKKNHQSNLYDNSKPSNTNQILNGSFNQDSNKNNLLYNIKGNYDSEKQLGNNYPKEQSNNNNILTNIRKSNTSGGSTSLQQNYIQNINLNQQQQLPPKTTNFVFPKSNNNEQNIKFSLNKSRDNINVDNNNALTQQKIESKKNDIMKSLLSTNKGISKKNSFSYASAIPNNLNNNNNNINTNNQKVIYSYSNNYTNPSSTKDKIKNFVYHLDDSNNKMSLQQKANEKDKIPKYNYNTFADTKYQPSLRERTTYVSSKYNTRKNNVDALGDFADFSIKKDNNNLSFSKQRTFSSDNVTYINDNTQKKTSKQFGNINQAEVRALAGKIRFLSNEDIRLMDRNVIEELLSLANVIKRTFDNK